MISIAMLTLSAALAQVPPPSVEAPPDPHALANAAFAALTAKCAECHSSNLPHPRGKFGYVTDLRRLVDSGKYVVPGSPRGSELWKQISDDDMPPDDARAGPLTESEKASILAWINAGAPALADEPPAEARTPTREPVSAPVEPTPRADPIPTPSFAARAVVLIGRMHVVIVHFPIALLVSAAAAEAWGLWRKTPTIAPATRFCLWLGAISAVAAGGLGWVHALDGFPGALANPWTIAGLHRWIGTGAAVLAPLVAIGAERAVRRGTCGPLLRWAIIALGILVGVAGHFGGLLTHGAEFLSP